MYFWQKNKNKNLDNRATSHLCDVARAPNTHRHIYACKCIKAHVCARYSVRYFAGTWYGGNARKTPGLISQQSR